MSTYFRTLHESAIQEPIATEIKSKFLNIFAKKQYKPELIKVLKRVK